MAKSTDQALREMEKRLKAHGLRVTRQRLQVALRVLTQHDHFTADDLIAWAARAKIRLSRATIYNSLNEFVAVGLLRSFQLTSASGEKQIFDSHTGRHYHFFDTETQRLYDLPAASVQVKIKNLPDFDVHETEVLFRGRREVRSHRR